MEYQLRVRLKWKQTSLLFTSNLFGITEKPTGEPVWKKIQVEAADVSGGEKKKSENVKKLKLIMQMLRLILTLQYLSEERQDRWLLNVTGR